MSMHEANVGDVLNKRQGREAALSCVDTAGALLSEDSSYALSNRTFILNAGLTCSILKASFAGADVIIQSRSNWKGFETKVEAVGEWQNGNLIIVSLKEI